MTKHYKIIVLNDGSTIVRITEKLKTSQNNKKETGNMAKIRTRITNIV